MEPHIRRVIARNYKSIAQVSVDLNALTVFVGPNGSGKSNFIDALAFVQDSQSETIELAFKNRGGIGAVRRKSAGHPRHIGISLSLDLGDNLTAAYAFEIAAKPTERFRVARERCEVCRFMGGTSAFEVRDGLFTEGIAGIRPKLMPDRLALSAAVSAVEEFRPVYDFLTSMRFYSVVPVRLRELQDPDPGDHLKRDGSNAAAVLKRLQEEANGAERYRRLCRLLSKVVSGLSKVEHRTVAQKETLLFRQDVGLDRPWTFDALNMSDGTLRVFGVLLAIYQSGRHSVIAIEEPEATVHPAVTELLVQALMDAAHERQILLTTHSPDVLDQKELRDTQIRVVTVDRNQTLISPVAPHSRASIKEHLYTPGELLRMGELAADTEEAGARAAEADLFAGVTFDDVRDNERSDPADC